VTPLATESGWSDSAAKFIFIFASVVIVALLISILGATLGVFG
jgi:hypothetical protein